MKEKIWLLVDLNYLLLITEFKVKSFLIKIRLFHLKFVFKNQ